MLSASKETKSRVVCDALKGKGVAFGVVQNLRAWHEVPAYLKPLRMSGLASWVDRFKVVKEAWATRKMNGYSAQIRFFRDGEIRRVSVSTSSRGEDMPEYAALLDLRLVPQEAFDFDTTIIAEAVAYVEGHEVEVGHEGVERARARVAERDPNCRVRLELHAFRLHRMGEIRGFDISSVVGMLRIVRFCIQGQPAVKLVHGMGLTLEGDVVTIRDTVRDIVEEIELDALMAQLLQMAGASEGWVLSMDHKRFEDEMRGVGNKKLTRKDDDVVRDKSMVKVKREIWVEAQVDLDPTTGRVQAWCYYGDTLQLCGNAEPFVGKALFDMNLRRARVGLIASWVTKRGMLMGIHKIYPGNIRADDAPLSQILDVIRGDPHISAVHAAKEALFAIRPFGGKRGVAEAEAPEERPTRTEEVEVPPVLEGHRVMLVLDPTTVEYKQRAADVAKYGGQCFGYQLVADPTLIVGPPGTQGNLPAFKKRYKSIRGPDQVLDYDGFKRWIDTRVHFRSRV